MKKVDKSVYRFLFLLFWFVSCGDGKDKPEGGEEVALEKNAKDGLGVETPSIIKKFKSSEVIEQEIEVDWDKNYSSQSITIEQRISWNSFFVSQEIRATHTDIFQQGHKGILQTDRFIQGHGNYGVLDILIIIDDSGSMEEEQYNLGNKLTPLLANIKDSNWQIAVATTTSGCIRRIIKRGDADAEWQFKKAINTGCDGSDDERGTQRAVEALNGGCMKTPWVRANSSIAVIIVSDEDNCSNGRCKGDDLMNYFLKHRDIGVDARAYGLVWHPNTIKSSCSTAYNQANIYSDIIKKTNGVWGSICNSDYSSSLLAMSADIFKILKPQYQLSYVPDGQLMEVKLNKQIQTKSYSFEDKVLSLVDLPFQGTTIDVRYTSGGKPLKHIFALSHLASDYNFEVIVNGNVISSDKYVLDNSTNEIVFNEFPEENSEIRGNYYESTSNLKRVFKFSTVDSFDVIKVFVDGIERDDFELDRSANSISFKYAPLDGAEIEIKLGTFKGESLLVYDTVISEQEYHGFGCFDAETEPIPCKVIDGQVIFENGFVEVGELMEIKYSNTVLESFKLNLQYKPISNSVSIHIADQVCDLDNGLIVTGQELDLENCQFDTDYSKFKIKYSYISQNTKSFEVDEIVDGNEYKWQVKVNDKDVDNYKVKGKVLSFDEDLPENADVYIEVSL